MPEFFLLLAFKNNLLKSKRKKDLNMLIWPSQWLRCWTSDAQVKGSIPKIEPRYFSFFVWIVSKKKSLFTILGIEPVTTQWDDERATNWAKLTIIRDKKQSAAAPSLGALEERPKNRPCLKKSPLALCLKNCPCLWKQPLSLGIAPVVCRSSCCLY